MSNKTQRWVMWLWLFLLVLMWVGFNIEKVFLMSLGEKGYHFHWYHPNGYTQAERVIMPLLTGVTFLYLWEKSQLENTRIAWLAFAFVVGATFIYTLATPIEKPPSDKPTIVCDKNGENCHAALAP